MIIITGASGAIGSKLFNHYYSTENDIIGTYNHSSKSEISGKRLFKLDVSNYAAVESFVTSVKNNLESICLVNGAAITYDAFTHKSDPEKWNEVIDVNLKGAYNMIRALLPIMREQEYGRIVNLSSVVAQKGAIGTSAYAASKSGLWGLTKTIALENANKNIHINSINLGYMEDGMTRRIPAPLQESMLEQIPMKKFGPVSDLILAIDFLIQSTYITGTTIDINGGLV